MCIKRNFYKRETEAFASPDGYELILPAERGRVIGSLIGHVAIYAHMLDFGLRFPLNPFMVTIFMA